MLRLRVAYLLEEKQLTKDYGISVEVIQRDFAPRHATKLPENSFHTVEANFLRRVLTTVRVPTNGRENLSPIRLYVAACSVRTTFASNVRAARGNDANAPKGELGISSEISVRNGIARRTATSIPPADTFNAVANSRNSLSCPISLLTKTGMAKGKRGHRLRSPADILAFTDDPR